MAYTPLTAEDGTVIYAEDGQDVLAEESTGTGEAEAVTGSMAAVEDQDTVAADGVVAAMAATGTMAVIEPRDSFTATGSIDTSGSMAVTDTGDGFAVTGTAGTSGTMAVIDVEDRFSASGSVLEAKPFVPRRPGRVEVPQVVAEKKRILAPVKTLPEPPKEYDPQWMQTLNEALLRHLDATLGASAPNQSVMLRSPGGQVFEVTIDDDGVVKSTPAKG